MAVILETKATKDEILELYLNDVYLGNRGSFALHGVAEAARIFFGKDVSNLSLSEAGADRRRDPEPVSALAVRQPRARQGAAQPRALGDGGGRLHHARGRRRAPRAIRSAVVRRAVDNEAPYFVDYLERGAAARSARHHAAPGARRLHDARPEPAALRAGRGPRRAAQGRSDACEAPAQAGAGAGGAGRHRSADRRSAGAGRRPLLQPVAVQPRDHRAPPAGLDLQAVRLSRRLRARSRRRPRPISRRPRWCGTSRRPGRSTTKEWAPRNYENEYDGFITLRRALALSRNIATIKVAEQAGFDRVASLWKKPSRSSRAAGLSLDRAGRVRGDADGDGDRLHDLRQRRPIRPLHATRASRAAKMRSCPSAEDHAVARERRPSS